MSDRVTISIRNGIADVRFNRPEKRNALDGEQFLAIAAAGERLKTEPGVRCRRPLGRGRLVLRRARLLVVPVDGRRWRRAPADRQPMAPSRTATRGRWSRGGITHLGQQVAWVWQEVPVPVIAAVHGHALGGGIQIALGADIRIVHPRDAAVRPRGALGTRARHDRHVHAQPARATRRRQGADVHGAGLLRGGGVRARAGDPALGHAVRRCDGAGARDRRSQPRRGPRREGALQRARERRRGRAVRRRAAGDRRADRLAEPGGVRDGRASRSVSPSSPTQVDAPSGAKPDGNWQHDPGRRATAA